MTNAPDAPAGPFYHGTKADLKVGDLIMPGYRSNYGDSKRTSPWVYMTATKSSLGAELARGDGPGRLYIVEPTGPFTDDPDLTDKKFPGNPTKSYRSRDPLRVVGEVTDWTPQPPEVIQAMRDNVAKFYAAQAERIAQIPDAASLTSWHADARSQVADSSSAMQSRGCICLMRIRGVQVEVKTRWHFEVPGVAEHAHVVLPAAGDHTEDWPAMPMSGQWHEVRHGHDGWIAVIESCMTEIGLSQETRLWVAVDADRDALHFRVESDGAERSWRRAFTMTAGRLCDDEHGEIWNFAPSAREVHPA